MNQLIRCVNCDEIFLKTTYDQWPEYKLIKDHPTESFWTIAKDDLRDFLKIHRSHKLEDLKILEDSIISEKDYAEPVKVSYFKATNGREKFVIKRFREKIDEPLRYKLIPGDFSLKLINIEIQSQEIEKQLKREFGDDVISQKKIDLFLKVYRRIIEAVDLKNLERVPEESHNPLEIYCKMDDLTLSYLLRNCRNIFKNKEFSGIEDFIYRHKDDGVLLLKATYKIKITEIAQSKKRATLAQPSLVADKKIVGKK
jgi:hypothetical protein